MKNVKEYLEKAYAAAMYEELFETAGFIEVAIGSLENVIEKERDDSSYSHSETALSVEENIVAFPAQYLK
ncbi:MAG: hypothetical protein JKY12_05855 [Sneathiella sp.]|nr:hypothetical protein [Sneathiella sp.]